MKVISIIGRGALIVAAAALAISCAKTGVNEERANAAPLSPAETAAPATAHSTSQNPEDKMARVKVDEAKKLVEDGKAIIIDVRGVDAYKMSHIKGALDVPLNRLESGDFKGLPKDKRIIAYCT